jgi:hypothetical protein
MAIVNTAQIRILIGISSPASLSARESRGQSISQWRCNTPRNQPVESKEPPAEILGSTPGRFPRDRPTAQRSTPKPQLRREGRSVAVFDGAAVRYLRGFDAADSVSCPQSEGVQLVAKPRETQRGIPVRQLVSAPLAVVLSPSDSGPTQAKSIQRDGEYYILEAQEAARWTANGEVVVTPSWNSIETT